ncbi:ATP-dependent DNA helicase RecG [Pasteurellaceae bacterium 15-036681]|nr:ATP-dependent DNA helicase RecG [Pasteurellaceae bacterium 15-036681]
MLKDYTIEELATMQENTFFDRKSARKEPKEILRHLIGFANAAGGILVIGIEDSGELTGFKHPKAHQAEEFTRALIELQRMPLPVKFHFRDITNNKGEADQILIFEISTAAGRVIESNDGKAYLRSMDSTLELRFEQRLQLEYEKGSRSFEDQIVRNATFEDDLDLELLTRYKALLKTDRSLQEILKARDLMTKEGEITNACILLFGNNPTRYFPNARVRFLRYDGNAPLTGRSFNIIKEFMFEEPIPKLIEQVKMITKTQLREFQRLGDNGQFEHTDEYPEFAWLEGIVNAVTHRSYSNQGDCIRIAMYDDRLEIFSPGGLPRPVTLENMYYTRLSRNPKIAKVLYDFGWVRELNEGVNRMTQEMNDYLLRNPIYLEPNENSVKLVLENDIEHRTIRDFERIEQILTQDVMAKLNENEKKILHYLYTNEQITVKITSEILSRSKLIARRTLQSLEKRNIIIWHGLSAKDPTQYFTLNTGETPIMEP